MADRKIVQRIKALLAKARDGATTQEEALIEKGVKAGLTYAEISLKFSHRSVDSVAHRIKKLAIPRPVKPGKRHELMRKIQQADDVKYNITRNSDPSVEDHTRYGIDHDAKGISIYEINENVCRCILRGEGENTVYCGKPRDTRVKRFSVCTDHGKMMLQSEAAVRLGLWDD